MTPERAAEVAEADGWPKIEACIVCGNTLHTGPDARRCSYHEREAIREFARANGLIIDEDNGGFHVRVSMRPADAGPEPRYRKSREVAPLYSCGKCGTGCAHNHKLPGKAQVIKQLRAMGTRRTDTAEGTVYEAPGVRYFFWRTLRAAGSDGG